MKFIKKNTLTIQPVGMKCLDKDPASLKLSSWLRMAPQQSITFASRHKPGANVSMFKRIDETLMPE